MPEPTCLAQKEDLRRYQAIFRNTLTVYSWDVARILLEVRHLVLDYAFQERSKTKFGNDQDSHLAMLISDSQLFSLSRTAYTTKEGGVNLEPS